MSGALSGIPGAGAILGKLGGAGNLIGGLGKAMGGGGGLGAIFNSLGGSKGALGSVLGALAPSGGAGGGLAGILGSFLGGGEGADDDADLDALADLVDARRISPAIALPIGASLAARTVARKGCSPAMQLPVNSRTLWKQGRAAQRTMLHAAAKAGGSPGRQLRLMRAIARLATYILRQRRGGVRQLPPTVRFAAARILRLAGGRPGLGAVPPQVARQKLAAREAILRKVPVSTLCRHTQPQAYA